MSGLIAWRWRKGRGQTRPVIEDLCEAGVFNRARARTPMTMFPAHSENIGWRTADSGLVTGEKPSK